MPEKECVTRAELSSRVSQHVGTGGRIANIELGTEELAKLIREASGALEILLRLERERRT
ncbi:MAG TPA: hypothetical protein VK735_40050 [Pseudonocardia sp.]|uniref:hypothetical protein n=1 Tax=Pseudonocardia sp. TaxID=60912 RepID=UPI002BFC0A2E|nr:hypothetical protein [Pseudonocardia sp.]HTF53678.1 hypothetical protein [Pseudonocardia sp.]